MKIRAIVVSSLLLAFGLLVGTSAQAQDVKGEIKVAGTKGVAGLKCNDIVVDVASKEQTTPPPGWKGPWFATPKWQRQGKASGSWASGACSYSVKVVANSEFNVHLAAETDVPCGGYDAATSTPAQSAWLKVAKGTEKAQDFTLDSVTCIPIP
jgi:hypothetical protein